MTDETRVLSVVHQDCRDMYGWDCAIVAVLDLIKREKP